MLASAILFTACGGGEPAVVTDSTAVAADSAATAARAAAPQAVTRVIDTAAAAGERPLLRETYGWTSGGRDPFRPVITTDISGPELSDLTLFAIIHDADNSNSLAMFREAGTTKRHSLRQGQTLGRIYVAAIRPSSVTLRVNDFGTVREQTYSLRRSENDTP
jgi:hypothetical protein